MKILWILISVVLILVAGALLILRTITSSRTLANERTAAVSMQIIGRAESKYIARQGRSAPALEDLKVEDDWYSRGVIDPVFTGKKAGYRYEYTATVLPDGDRKAFFVRAVPVSDANEEAREICMDQTGTIRIASQDARCGPMSEAIRGVDKWGGPEIPKR